MSRGSTGVEETIDFGLNELGGEDESKLEMQKDIWKDLEGKDALLKRRGLRQRTKQHGDKYANTSGTDEREEYSRKR